MPEIPTTPRRLLVAAIIPAYNEAENISEVLAVLRNVEIINEIIVVDDGSPDETPERVRQAGVHDPRVHLLQHPANRGKGQAIFTGWHATQATFLLLLDADLVNLTPGHVHALMAPVLTRKADMTLGLFWGGRIHTDFAHWATPWLTGQRCLRAEILKHVSREAAKGYGFEVALTVAVHQRGYRIRIVRLRGMWHPPSEFHRGWLYGIRWRARMYGQIIRAWYIATRERWPNAKAFFSSLLKP